MERETKKDLSSQYLTFVLNGEVYALNVLNVREVQGAIPHTRIPRMPPCMLGVINLRGSVIPIIDLKTKFQLEPSGGKTLRPSVVVAELELEEGLLIMGLLVDGVQEVISLLDSDIEPAPYVGTGIDVSFIRGVGKYRDGFVVILDVNKVLSFEEVVEIQASQEGKKEKDFREGPEDRGAPGKGDKMLAGGDFGYGGW